MVGIIEARACLLALLNGSPVPSAVVCATDDLLGVASDEGVVGLLAEPVWVVFGGSCPDLCQAFTSASRGLVAQELARKAEAHAVFSALSNVGIAALALKGTALAYWLYSEPSHRFRGDFDLLVGGVAEAERAAAELEALGYRYVAMSVTEAAGFECALERTTPRGTVHRIDLHWRLLDNARLSAGFDFAGLMGRSVSLPALHPSARALGRVDAIAHALLHRVTNLPSGQQDRLIWLYDIHLLARGCDDAQWQELAYLAGARRIATPILDGLRATHVALGTSVPSEVEHALTAMVAGESWELPRLDIGSLDRMHLAELDWQDKLHWMRRKFFPSRRFMRLRYGAEGWAGLLLAYGLRWWIAVRRSVGCN